MIRCALRARLLTAPRQMPRALLAFRFNSTKQEKTPEKPQSILDEDMLARSGIDTEEPNKEPKGDKEHPGADSGRGRRSRARSSKDKQREKYASWFYRAALAGGVVGFGFLCRNWDSEEEQKANNGLEVPDGYDFSAIKGRVSSRLSSFFTFFSEPAFEKLLPPPAPEAYRRPLTLVLTLNDLLVHSDWDVKNGWKTAKRPGLDYFLGYLSAYYEIVIFGSKPQVFWDTVVQKLDPYHAYISYALFKEACRYKDGKLIKDLSLLDRDLNKTVLVDIDQDAISMHPDNSVLLKPWDGQKDDELIRLIPFLEYLATQNVLDVRPIIKSFDKKDGIIDEYSEREATYRKKWMEDNKHLVAASNRPNAGNFLASLLGLPQNSINKGPKFPLDAIREHGQMQYEQFQRYLQENAPKIMAEEQKLREEFGKVTLNKLLTEGPPSAEDVAKFQAKAQAEN